MWQKKTQTFGKAFCSMQTFLELQCLVVYLVDYLELSKFSNTLCLKNYLMGIDGIRDSDMKKKHCKEQMLYRKRWPCVRS